MTSLGYFASLPSEIRIVIYRHLSPESSFFRLEDSNVAKSIPMKSRNGTYNENEGCCHFTAWGDEKGILSLLSTSREICTEVQLELYKERELVIHFNPSQHIDGAVNRYDEPDFEHPTFGKFPTRLGDFCSTRNFTHTNFSRFTSIRLEMFFPSSTRYSIFFENLRKVVPFHELLRKQIENFAIIIEQWQHKGVLQKNRIVPACPKINIVLKSAPDPPGIPPGIDVKAERKQMTTVELKKVLKSLTRIKRVREVTFDERMDFEESSLPTTTVLDEIKVEMESSTSAAEQRA